MPFRKPEFYATGNQKVWKRTIARAIARGDVVTLSQCRNALSRFVKDSGGNLQRSALERVTTDLKELCRHKTIELCRLIDLYPWPNDKLRLEEASYDIQRLRTELATANPAVKDWGKADYVKLRNQILQKRHRLAPLLHDEFDGYASDDSDDEADEDDEPEQVPLRARFVQKKGKAKPVLNVMARIPQHLRNNPFAPLLVADEVQEELDKAQSLPNYARLAKARKPTARKHRLDPDPEWVYATTMENLQEFWDKKNKGNVQVSDNELHTQNAQIHHDMDWTKGVEADFQRARQIFAALNKVEADGDADAELKEKARGEARQALGQLKTKFCIAQYRGITYKTSGFDRASRQSSRETIEVGQPIYSFSVFKAAGVNPAAYFANQTTEEDMRRLAVVAEQLKSVLVDKRSSGALTYLNYEYDSQAHALQDVYTNKYDYFHAAIQLYFAEQSGWVKARLKKAEEELAGGEGWEKKPQLVKDRMIRQKVFGSFAPPDNFDLFKGLLNAECPFVSTGDVPRHALKYAYGKKFYEGHKHERLLPRWNPRGRAEQPYSGKVYVSLHGLADYISDAPLHVRTLNNQGKIKVAADIALERETTFPAYIPAGRLAIEHIAKIPSFIQEDGWRPLYLKKYGITEDDYAAHYKAIRQESVQEKAYGEFGEKENKVEKTGGTYINLDSWLVNFHEVRLIELARQLALSRGEYLIYRDEDGELSKELPVPLSVEGQKLKDEKKKRTKGNRSFDSDLVNLKKAIGRSSVSERVGRIFKVNSTPGNGNCLFLALSAALQHAANVAVDDLTLRGQICDVYAGSAQLRAAQRITQPYLVQMRQRARSALDVVRWGSDAEIIAFTHAYPHVRVRVFSPTYPAPHYYAEFTKFGERIDHTINLLHQGGNHWTWLSRQ